MRSAQEDEVVLKLLHTADWHLGRRFPRFDKAAQDRLTRARLEVLDRILGLAERYRVDAVLCAGDLFDEPCPANKWWEPLVERFRKCAWPDRHVFLLPGNHDPLTADAVWQKEQFRSSLPNFVHIVDSASFEWQLPNGAILYAVPCTSKAGQRDPTLSIPTREAGDQRVRIGMVHGSTFDAADGQTNFPIDKDAVVRCGLDYLAIGDTHGFRFVPPERQHPPTVYPGTPEPTAFDEKHPGFVALVSIDRKRRVEVRQERVAYWTWEEVRVESIDELRRLAARSDLVNRVLRLIIEMRVSAPEYQEAERLIEELTGTEARHGKAGVLELERHGLALDTTSLDAYCTDLPAVLQAAVARLKEIAERDEDRAAAERALYHLYRVSRRKAC